MVGLRKKRSTTGESNRWLMQPFQSCAAAQMLLWTFPGAKSVNWFRVAPVIFRCLPQAGNGITIARPGPIGAKVFSAECFGFSLAGERILGIGIKRSAIRS
jgi:hypothetical protein